MPPAVKPRLVTLAAACLMALIGCSREKPAPAQVQALPSATTLPALAPTRVQALPSATTLPAPTLAASDRPVILLYQESHSGDPGMPRQQVTTAVWSDGRIVWRANGDLLQSRIDVKKIDELLQRLHRQGVFGDGKAYYGNTGPDSSFDVIKVCLADRQLEMNSWHDAFETDPRVVVRSRGVESLGGRNRDAVLAAEPPEYQRFRQIWSDIRSTIESWTPSKGEPFTGTIVVGRGV
jgi:hypothetical protein